MSNFYFILRILSTMNISDDIVLRQDTSANLLHEVLFHVILVLSIHDANVTIYVVVVPYERKTDALSKGMSNVGPKGNIYMSFIHGVCDGNVSFHKDT